MFVGSYRPNIAATFEPEPDTKVTKKPKRLSTRSKVKVKIKFSRVDRRLDVPVQARRPQEVEAVQVPLQAEARRGDAQAGVRAVSPAGVPDPKPAKAKFTIRRA